MKLILIFAALSLFGGEARAETPTYEVAYSSFASVGVRCSTGTVIQINLTRPAGFSANVAGYRFLNQASDASWIGGASVSTATANGDNLDNLGEKLASGSSSVFQVFKDYRRNGSIVPVYCKAADALGANGAVLSVVWFGY